MLLGLKELKLLEEKLDSFVNDNIIYKYRIYLNLNTTISVDIVGGKNDEIKEKIENSGLVEISIDEWIDKNEYENDKYYKKLFEKKIDKEHRRRLINLIDNKEQERKNNIPVVTFYSYKGGVGRTTALITFANYYAYHHKKKVVILDFDFEAPGFTNYFDFSLDALEKKNGVLEYILDKEASKETVDLLTDYMIEVSKEYSGDGSIYVMPSGNLFGQENLESYIEALARIDINSTDTITNQILGLIDDINKTIKPDVILIDSRTGFNDVFGFLINRISNTIVGLFEGNKQTEPGLHLFLNEIYNEEQKNVNPILVNSLVHKDSAYSKRMKNFSEQVNNYLIEITGENPSPEIFDLRKSNILGNLGTIEDDKDDYFEFIKESTPNDYQKFFTKVIEFIEFKKEDSKVKELIPLKTYTKKKKKISEYTIEELKTNLLKQIYDNYPEPYAEDYRDEIMQYNTDFFDTKFFFRKSMEDIFNFDKFLLIGGKGTGKTMFYSALKNETFLHTLQNKANKERFKYTVIDIISLREDKNKDKYFETINFDLKHKEIFYKKFWIIYILNSIMLNKNSALNNYSFSQKIKDFLPQKLNNTETNKIFFEEIIVNSKQFILVEKELENIDLFLRKKDINMMITFDQLDRIVKPNDWATAISPLLNYIGSNSFQRIQAKLFIRRDLYDKLSNITNKNALDTKSISLEWTMEEVFSFFFKIVFSYGKEEFFELMNRYAEIDKERIKRIQNNIEKEKSLNQIKLDVHWIKSLVQTFFGKYPNKNDSNMRRYAETYDWFFNNLKDSNGTISLRPFLDLIKFSIERSVKNTNKYHPNPILGAFFYDHAEVREKYVFRHFNDLASEEGNEDFKSIIEHIKKSPKFPKEFKIRELNEEKFDRFLNHFIKSRELDFKSKTKADIEEILISNGVVSVSHIRGGKRRHSFAYLYKYYLELKG
jgi:MinD-like ATPase involved in chromosome partitioning or flagellar assembly